MTVLPNELFTLQSMFTLTGATGVVFVICNALQSAFQFNPRWLALTISLTLSLFAAYFNCEAAGTGHAGAVDYVVGIVNGFLIYATATGTTQIIGSNVIKPNPAGSNGPAPAAQTIKNIPRKFLSTWW